MTEPVAPWWRRGTIYQIYPRSFSDSDGDGNGDLRGVLDRIEHLADLGVDAVWLTPFMASPQVDNGYDVADHCAVDPMYGTSDDLDALIAGLHDRAIRVVVDLVVNHTSDRHDWFVRARSSRDDPFHSWYIWAEPRLDEAGERRPPTNWRSNFGGSAWTWNEPTGEYYLHLFDPAQPDLNWENPAVRRAMADVVRWWRDRGVDGFRLDVANHISKTYAEDGTLPDAEPTEADRRRGDGLADGSPSFVRGPRLEEFLTELRRDAFAGPTARGEPLLVVGETPGADLPDAQRLTGPGGPLDMLFTFEHMRLDRPGGDKWRQGPLELDRLKEWASRWQAGLHDVGWNALYWENHDQPRATTRWGDDGGHRTASAQALLTVLALMQGTLFLYQGQEWGAADGHFRTVGEFRDVASLFRLRELIDGGMSEREAVTLVRRAARDNARIPMRWDARAPHGGFTSGEPWMGPGSAVWGDDADGRATHGEAVLAHVRALVDLRHRLDVLEEGTFALLDSGPTVFAYRRSTTVDDVVVVANWSSEAAPVPESLPAWARGGTPILHTGAPSPAGRSVGSRSTLGPWECAVWHRGQD